MMKRRLISIALAVLCWAACALPAFATGTTQSRPVPIGDFTYILNDGKATARIWTGNGTFAAVPATVTGSDGTEYKVTELSDGCFSANYTADRSRTLTTIELPEGLEAIGRAAFSGCTSLETLKIPESVTAIDTYAFENCPRLTDIRIPDAVSRIETAAFDGCSALRSVHIPSALTFIGDQAFQNCSSLESVSLPAGIEHIGPDSFTNAGANAGMLNISFDGTPDKWEAAANGTSWFQGTGHAVVLCRIPDALITQDVSYTAGENRWKALITLPLSASDWTVDRLQKARATASERSTSTGRNAGIELHIEGGEGKSEHATLIGTNAKASVTLRTENDVTVQVGWTPEDQNTWIEISNSAPKPDEEISITLKPKMGNLDAEITREGAGSIVLDNVSGKIEASAASPCTLRGKVQGNPGDKIQLRLSGSFRHDLGHGTYSILLPEITIAQGTESEPPKPQETEKNEPTKAPDPTSVPTPSQTATQNPPSNTPSPVPTQTASTPPTASVSAQPAPAQTPTATPSPTAAVTPKPSASATASPTATPTPQPTERPGAKPTQSPSSSASNGRNEEDQQRPTTTPDQNPKEPSLKPEAGLVIAGHGDESILRGSLGENGQSVIDVGVARDGFEDVEGILVEIVDHDGVHVLDHMPLATGYQVLFRLENSGEIIRRIPIIVMGDVCGTGYMSLTQLVRMAKGYSGSTRLISPYLNAGDFDGNEKIDLTDLVKEAALYRRSQGALSPR